MHRQSSSPTILNPTTSFTAQSPPFHKEASRSYQNKTERGNRQQTTILTMLTICLILSISPLLALALASASSPAYEVSNYISDCVGFCYYTFSITYTAPTKSCLPELSEPSFNTTCSYSTDSKHDSNNLHQLLLPTPKYKQHSFPR